MLLGLVDLLRSNLWWTKSFLNRLHALLEPWLHLLFRPHLRTEKVKGVRNLYLDFWGPVNTVCRWDDLFGLQGIFETAGDYEAFEQVLIEAHERRSRVIA